MVDNVKLFGAFLCVAAGVFGFHYFSQQPLVVRVLMVLAGLAIGAGVAWLSQPGKTFVEFAKEAIAEAKKVAWPTRKETMQTTLIVFVFVAIMSAFLALVDGSLAWLLSFINGRRGA
jgi:preprotein translocase subunit SecE